MDTQPSHATAGDHGESGNDYGQRPREPWELLRGLALAPEPAESRYLRSEISSFHRYILAQWEREADRDRLLQPDYD